MQLEIEPEQNLHQQYYLEQQPQQENTQTEQIAEENKEEITQGVIIPDNPNYTLKIELSRINKNELRAAIEINNDNTCVLYRETSIADNISTLGIFSQAY